MMLALLFAITSIAHDGFMVPVPSASYRVNVLISANANVPPQVWASPAFLTFVGATNGTFPVKLWRLRAGSPPASLGTVRIPAKQSGSLQITLQALPLRKGDLLAVEYTPAMLTFPCTDADNGGGHAVCGPSVSTIDNRTNDPTTSYSFKSTFSTEVTP